VAQGLNTVEQDYKADKKRLKEEKNRLKQQQKQQKKEAKARAKELALEEAELVDEMEGNPFSVAVVTIIIVIVWIAIICLLIKLDVGGFGTSVMTPLLKNVPVVKTLDALQSHRDGAVILALEGIQAPGYRQVADLAKRLSRNVREPLLICLEQDMAKALGQALAVRLPKDAQILCIDRIRVEEGSYLDIGQPVSGALPVVVKTLVLSK
jgi:hypothetical protein